MTIVAAPESGIGTEDRSRDRRDRLEGQDRSDRHEVIRRCRFWHVAGSAADIHAPVGGVEAEAPQMTYTELLAMDPNGRDHPVRRGRDVRLKDRRRRGADRTTEGAATRIRRADPARLDGCDPGAFAGRLRQDAVHVDQTRGIDESEQDEQEDRQDEREFDQALTSLDARMPHAACASNLVDDHVRDGEWPQDH